MKEEYLRYYEQFTWMAVARFTWDALFLKSNSAKQSLANRNRDYIKLNGNPDLLALHTDLNKNLLAATRKWKGFDYGEGYFYQSLESIGVSGLRDTRGRVAAMSLKERLRGKSVLEIGCNSGFLSLAVADAADRVVSFDINPFLVDIGKETARHLEIENVELIATAFEQFETSEKFDAVLSFANHSTYDGNTKQSRQDYFQSCSRLLKPGGTFLFESHHPDYEGDGLEKVCTILGDTFDIESRAVTDYGTFLDRGRTFVVARRRKEGGT